jgi:hypothetical protein
MKMNATTDENSETVSTPEERVETKEEGLTTAAIAGSQPKADVGEPRSFASGEPAEGRELRAETEEAAPLFAADEASDLRSRWDGVQTSFVDAPRKAVEEADGLVATAMKRLAEMFAAERAQLEGQWDRGDDVSTEDLRVALRRYRSFFTRLLSV